jgi:hypothetical protein
MLLLRGTDPKGSDVEDTNWMARGKCRDQPREMFFPSHGVGVSVRIGKRVCAECLAQEL